MEVVEAFVIFAAPAVVVSSAEHTKDVVEVHAVMLPTVADPPERVTVPHTMRGEVCAVFEHVVVVPHVLTLGNAVSSVPLSCSRPVVFEKVAMSPATVAPLALSIKDPAVPVSGIVMAILVEALELAESVV